ncbi:Thioredoxin domain-containing protein [Stanieria cyanosphaera PCC 7437]|uniref:Thioredoxin domain-containing protein n=1 Tax=Stanieria cyanosphaera (strain ATCC 29371 / PCC 7437) TaxID=111780 RepID=K9XSV6_STAC7|nr:thioredoxin family protein [Stanieria cyanosphaera]AFZ35161.1 Thioredoxin domain-containing protein [Stanieria cyanosphaera PCC 7437]
MNPNPSESPTNNRFRNILLALVAIALGISLFFSSQTQTSANSLETQAQQSTALEVALSNGKPTLTEFYADWCNTCQAMAEDLAAVKQKYQDSVNFVMLNVDNTKWLPEILRYQVDGIPHFVFINQTGEAIAEAIGEQPRPILEANLDALIAQNALPYANSTGQVSQVERSISAAKNSKDDPRSHSAQVQ